jgi:hypothetical protein
MTLDNLANNLVENFGGKIYICEGSLLEKDATIGIRELILPPAEEKLSRLLKEYLIKSGYDLVSKDGLIFKNARGDEKIVLHNYFKNTSKLIITIS